MRPYNVSVATDVRLQRSRRQVCRPGRSLQHPRPSHRCTVQRFIATDVRLQTGVAAKFDDPDALFSILNRLIAAPYNVQSLQTFVCNGVAAKFDDPDALFSILGRLVAAPYNVQSLQTFVCNGVAAKFDDPDALFSILDRLVAAPYNVKSLQTFVCNGIAAKFDDPDALFSILGRLVAEPYKVQSLQTFVCGGIASKFADPDRMFAAIDRLHDQLGQTALDVLSNNGAFASRLYKDGFIDHVLAIANHLQGIRASVHTSLMLMLDRNNCKLMDKIKKLETKLKTFKTPGDLVFFIQSYKYLLRTRVVPITRPQ